MPEIQPLRDHPELKVINHSTFREYRVENWRFARNGSSKVIKFYGWSWLDALVPLLVAFLWPTVCMT